jgi:hypothetical protein
MMNPRRHHHDHHLLLLHSPFSSFKSELLEEVQHSLRDEHRYFCFGDMLC